MAKTKVGIIGCGGIANAKHMPGLKACPDAEMVAFCDIVIERAETAAKQYGVPGAKVYEDYKELLKDESIEVVHVLTPNRAHSFITVDALNAGKHVMCEKPMAINSAEAKKMLDAAKKNGKKLTIGYQNRQSAEARFMKAEADKGTFGEIYYARALALRRRAVPTWGVFLNEEEQGGGSLIDIGTHSLDLTLWMMNNYSPKYCLGQTFHKLNNDKPGEQGNVWGAWDPAKFTVEDSAFGLVVMENGATISVESAWALNTLDVREATTSICGTKAGGELLPGVGVRINGIRGGYQYTQDITMTGSAAAFYDGVGDEPGHIREAKLWIKAVREDKDPFVLPEQAYVVTRILEGIYESARTGDIYRF